MRPDFDRRATCSGIAGARNMRVTRLSHQRVNGVYRPPRISWHDESMSLPEWMHALKVNVLQKPPGSSARLKGSVSSSASRSPAMAIFALTHALKHVDYDEVLAVVRRTDAGLIALALAAGRRLLRQPDAVRSAGASHHRAHRRALPDRGAGEFHQLSDRARHRRGGADLAGHPLPDLFVQRPRRGRRREYLLSDRADILARQSDRVRAQRADASPTPSA